MPKLYHQDAGGWIVPGLQDRSALRVDVPNNPQDLAAWLNQRDVRPTAFRVELVVPAPGNPLYQAPAPASSAGLSLVLDDAWEELPLARQLHFAALALERARVEIKRA